MFRGPPGRISRTTSGRGPQD